jgi:tRNA/tmRNA/rRNA uracil-C5-methylase (TrmA/RlmC/RlmD family)
VNTAPQTTTAAKAEKPDWRDRLVEVEVGPVAHGGHCVARHEGRVLFVRHTLPGERVVARVTEDNGGSFCRADAVEVLTPSPDRVEPACPFSGPGRCGGCDWQHASWEWQRDAKAAVVAEQLSRLAKLELDVVVEELPGGPLRWRTRARTAADRKGRAGFRAFHSHRIIAVDHCPITVPGAVEAVAKRDWPRDTEQQMTVDHTGELHLSEITVEAKRGHGLVPVRTRRVKGGERAVEQAAGRTWDLSADAFWQVHHDAADVLASAVRKWAGALPGERAWDLYGGVGLFASVLADQVGETGSVLVVESSSQAVADGRRNLSDLPQVEFVGAKVEHALASPSFADDRPDVVVLDPPRKGAGRAVVGEITRRGPARVVYVACDPAALARDVAIFAEQGYRLANLRAFDAFPMTHHVECVALLVPTGEDWTEEG